MSENKQELKTFNVRLTKEMWMFVKTYAMGNNLTMNNTIVTLLKKLQEKEENKLQRNQNVA